MQVHPDGALYLGDQVSFEVIAPEGFPAAGKKAEVRLGGPEGALIGGGEFGPFGLDERIQATVLWGWDTSGLAAGEHILTFIIRPDGPLWSETFTLLPYGQLSSAERQAHWESAQNGCCIVHYITGTAAERDLPDLLTMFDDQADLAASRLGVLIGQKVEVALIPRVLGHGGFAGEGITLSYLDSNYAGGSREMLFHHELVHILDTRLGGGLRLPFLIEGLAVFLTGGHFKPEPLLQRAAALLPPEPGCGVPDEKNATEACGLEMYIPLPELIDFFYQQQHETGYLEAGAFTAYLVEKYGWSAFSNFYRDIHPGDASNGEPQPDSSFVDAAAERHFGFSLEQLEQGFIERLKAERLTLEWAEDLRLAATFYDRVREYQLSFDPSAYFLHAWLPPIEQMRNRKSLPILIADRRHRRT